MANKLCQTCQGTEEVEYTKFDGSVDVCGCPECSESELQATNLKLVEVLKAARCPNYHCLDGTLRTKKGTGWNLEADLGPCSWCAKRSALIGEVEGE